MAQAQIRSFCVFGQSRCFRLTIALVCLMLGISRNEVRAATPSSGLTVCSSSMSYFNIVTQKTVSLEDDQQPYYDSLNPTGTANTYLGFGSATVSTSATVNLSNLSISGESNSTAGPNSVPGQYFGLQQTARISGSEIDVGGYYLPAGNPFLFRATGVVNAIGGGFSEITVQGKNPIGWSGLGIVRDTDPNTSLAVSGIATGVRLNARAWASGSLIVDSHDSYSAHLEVDENVVQGVGWNDWQFAPPGQAGMAVNYPARTTYTGLTEAQFTNVNGIIYNPPSGSVLSSGRTNVTSTVNYKWGVTQTDGFTVDVIPGFAPADIVRISWNGQSLPVSFVAPFLPAGLVSNVSFNTYSGTGFRIGMTPIDCSAYVTGLGTRTRTFKVTIINGSSWATSGPPLALQGDTDHDGQADWLEIEAGTNANDPADRFTVQNVLRSGSDMVISWYGAGGITYQLESISLTGGPSTPIGAPVTAIGTRPLLTVTDLGAVTAHASKFYRVKVVIP